MKIPIIIAALVGSVATSPAAAMDVETYVRMGNALMAKGVMAVFSKEYGTLTRELKSSSDALKKERLADLRLGRTPAFCSAGTIGQVEVFTAFKAIPAAQRRQLQVKDALRRVYAKKYPCGA